MAYVTCERCGRRAFTTAYWSSTDYCHYCGTELPHPLSVAQPLTRQPRIPGGYRFSDTRSRDTRPAA